MVEAFATVLAENTAFCKLNLDCRETYIEIQNLMNYARYCTLWEDQVSPSELGKTVSESAMFTYLSYILRPLAWGIFLDFLAGNEIAAFMQLRTLLEQLAKCYEADVMTELSNVTFFQKRIIALEETRRSTSKIIGALGPGSEELWSKLSEEWVHLRSMGKLVTAVIERGMPGYAIVIPASYGAEDIPDIRELGQAVKQFRGLLSSTLDKWQTSHIFPKR